MLSVLIVILLAQRQFYDELIPCLRIESECTETESPFKDDELENRWCPTIELEDLEYPNYEENPTT